MHVDELRSHPGFRLLLWAGLASGAAVALWLVFGHGLLARDPWLPFDPRRLVTDFELRWMAPLRFADDRTLALYWGPAAALLPLVFGAVWWRWRRQDVLIERDILLQTRRVEHQRYLERADSLWQRFEHAELHADPETQVRSLEAYREAAQFAQLTADVRADRVAACRSLAAQVAVTQPDLGLKVLELARALHRSGRAQGAALWPLIAPDLLGYALGLLTVLVLLPLVALAVLWVIGLAVWILKLVLTILVVVLVIVVVLSALGNS